MAFAPPIVLTFAASDPTGGAGLQADVLTLAGMGCHPLSVVTALTVQDTHGVEDVLAVESSWVREQAVRVLRDVRVAAFKVGVLGSAANVDAVAEVVSAYPEVPLILDPVLTSGRGDVLASEAMASALCDLLLPRSTVVTPNSLEARRLAAPHDDSCTLGDCARRLLDMGARYVLLTGTHEPGSEVVNTLYDGGGIVREDRWPRLAHEYHGSGCTLASAIAAALANGLAVADAARAAQEFTWQALSGGFPAGTGQLVPDRFFWAREPRPDRQ